MYLYKCAQYSEGKFVGCDEGDFYKGTCVFVIQGLKKSVPVVVKGYPITTLNGKWLANAIASCIFALDNSGFKVRAIVTDNHAANVNAFKALRTMLSAESDLYIKHSENETITYLLFDNVHLIKNIRNNILNAKKLVFPSFLFNINEEAIESSPVYIAWSDLKLIYDEDCKLSANLRKAHKLTFKSLHPFSNKQNVSLALNIFDKSTIAGCKCYCPQRKNMQSFLIMINK